MSNPNETIESSDPFAVDLSSVDTDYQVLAPGSYRMRISECKKEATKKGGEQLVIKLTLEDSNALDTKGKPVVIGYALTHRIGLTLSEKYTSDMRAKSLKNVMESFKPTATGSFGDPASYLGEIAIVRTKVEPEKDGFPESTRVSKFFPVS